MFEFIDVHDLYRSFYARSLLQRQGGLGQPEEEVLDEVLEMRSWTAKKFSAQTIVNKIKLLIKYKSENVINYRLTIKNIYLRQYI